MNIEQVSERYGGPTVALLEDLHVSPFGIRSRRLLNVLVKDGMSGRIDCRIAADQGEAKGVVLVGPSQYWWRLPATHWGIGAACLVARLTRGPKSVAPAAAVPSETLALLQSGAPPRTWNDPGDAWRIIFVGTAAEARGKGIAAQLYRSVMADRSLVARVALENTPSIRLHHSLGWRLYRDGDVALAVHGRD